MFSVIFDMDGTLLDTQRPYITAWEWAGEKQGYKNFGKYISRVCGMNEMGVRAFVTERYPEIDIVKFRADVRQYMHDNLVVRFKEGAKELLDYLKARDIKIALATGTSRPSAEHHLKEVGILEMFDVIVCGTEVENGKPAPDVFLKTAELLGADPADCFVFEDSENGINAGFAAGMKCIGIEDVAIFGEEAKKRMFCQLDNLSQAIEIFEKM